MADKLTILNRDSSDETMEQERGLYERLASIEQLCKSFYTPKIKAVSCEKIVVCSGAYEAEDVVSESTTIGTAWGFPGMAKENGGGGFIVGGLITAETTAIASWFSLFLHTDVPTCALNDDAANTAPLKADRHIYVGRIDFPACDDIGTGMSETMATPSTVGKLPMPFVCKANSSTLRGVLAIRNAVDLADFTVLRITLFVEQI